MNDIRKYTQKQINVLLDKKQIRKYNISLSKIYHRRIKIVTMLEKMR